MKEIVKVSILQFEVMADCLDPDVKEDNMSKLLGMIEQESKDSQPDMIILPDEFYGGYGYGVMNMPDFAQSDDFESLCSCAKENNIYIAGATLFPPEIPEGYKTYSTGFIIGPDGEMVGQQNRIHVHERELDWVLPGKEISIIDTPLGKIGFVIGMDIYYPEITRKLALAGADIIIHPQLTIDNVDGFHEIDYPVDYIKLSDVHENMCKTRAVENQVYLLSASALGEYVHADKFNLIGKSMVVTPQGKADILSSGEEGVIRATLSKKDLDVTRDVFTLMSKRSEEELKIV